MALYKDFHRLMISNNPAFDAVHDPGAATPHAGIYRCEGCGYEVASSEGNPLPPQNHHQHSPGQSAIRWRLVVCAQPKAP